jgi:hypothetical protein
MTEGPAARPQVSGNVSLSRRSTAARYIEVVRRWITPSACAMETVDAAGPFRFLWTFGMPRRTITRARSREATKTSIQPGWRHD